MSKNSWTEWNYIPSNDVKTNPLFEWPLDFKAIFNWYRNAWFKITSITTAFLFALLLWNFLMPNISEFRSMNVSTIVRLWLSNLIPQVVVASTLQYLLYVRSHDRQSKFYHGDPDKENKKFLFNNQLYDNVVRTLVSAITIATVYQAIIFHLMSRDIFLFNIDLPSYFTVIFVLLIPIVSGIHYYWTHRFMHWPKVFKYVHATHHTNINTGPWTGISNHWSENILYFSGYFLHLIVPLNPFVLFWHAMYQQVTPVFSHSGFEEIDLGLKKNIRGGDYFHHLHHRYFTKNFGTTEIPFDKWFGTFLAHEPSHRTKPSDLAAQD